MPSSVGSGCGAVVMTLNPSWRKFTLNAPLSKVARGLRCAALLNRLAKKFIYSHMVGIAIVGAGAWGLNHVRTCSNLDGARLLCICDRSAAALECAAMSKDEESC